ncbi:helix-turn-helix domain-containing protein [Terrabacter sp. NPDC000476]|uniref:helix-turn-helix domain-containing protein n=1 Tax=Terrabacter sp. NPDC000476 TaxID=3154258 RepID=UPI0033335C8E
MGTRKTGEVLNPGDALSGHLTLQQGAAYLNCSVQTLKRRIEDGNLPCYWLDQRTRLVKRADLDTLVIRRIVRR